MRLIKLCLVTILLIGPINGIADLKIEKGIPAPFSGVLCPIPTYRDYQEAVDLSKFYKQKLNDKEEYDSLHAYDILSFIAGGAILGFTLATVTQGNRR